MPISDHLRALRAKIGHDLLVMPAVTAIVYDDEGRVLLVKHSNRGVWVAPGGAVDPDERPVDAVVREVWEETGLLVAPVALCGVFGGPEFHVHYENGDAVSYVMAVYECRRLGGTLAADGVETLDARYFAPGELAALDLSRWARVTLPHILAHRGETWIPAVEWKPPAG